MEDSKFRLKIIIPDKDGTIKDEEFTQSVQEYLKKDMPIFTLKHENEMVFPFSDISGIIDGCEKCDDGRLYAEVRTSPTFDGKLAAELIEKFTGKMVLTPNGFCKKEDGVISDLEIVSFILDKIENYNKQ